MTAECDVVCGSWGAGLLAFDHLGDMLQKAGLIVAVIAIVFIGFWLVCGRE